MISMDNAEKAGISMLQWIPTLPDRFLPRKCPVGYVPTCRLILNVNYCGFKAYASMASATNFQPGFKAFKGNGSEQQWQPLQTTLLLVDRYHLPNPCEDLEDCTKR